MADSDNDSGGKSTPRGGGGSGHELSSPREQERFLPIANVSRIMKKALPANAKISKDAKETVQECVSEFISFVTGEAADKCQREKRKTINGDDLLWAMTALGFEDYIEPLKLYLQRYRELEGDKMVSGKERDRDHAGAGVVGGFGVVCGGNVVNTGANGGVYGSRVVMMGQPVGPGQGQVHSRGPGGMYSQVRGEVVDTILAHSSVNGRSI